MTDIKHVIFDCDGVLVDSEILSMELWLNLLAERHITIDETYFRQHFLGRSFEHVKAHIYSEFGLHITPAIQEEFAQRLQEVFAQHLQVTPGLLTMLPYLKISYALATSSSLERTRHALRCTGLDTFFTPDKLFTASMVENGKPAPDLFLLVAGHYAVTPEQCLVIEDSAPGLAAAKAAAMQWRHYTGAGHMSGHSEVNQETLTTWKEFVVQFPDLF